MAPTLQMTPSPNSSAGVNPSHIKHHMDHQQSRTLPTSIANGVLNIPNGITPNGLSSSNLNGTNNINIGLDYLCESDRLRSFENWPVPFMNTNDLAAAGFYYINRDDIVKCAFCSIEVGRWEEGDDPVADHRRYSPHCRFIMQRSRTSSTSSGNSSTNTIPNGYDTCGLFGIGGVRRESRTDADRNVKETALEKLGIHTSRAPRFPHFATSETRVKSYDTWPISMKLKPNALSEAGFFYTGKGDQTICFHCGGGLKDWEESDDPWVEHARWFSRCNYVLLIKGKEFVDEVCGKNNEVLSLTKEEMKSVIASHSEVVPITSSSSSQSSNESGYSEAMDIDTTSTSLSKSDSIKTEGILANDKSNLSLDETELKVSKICKICFVEEMSVVFLPCGHMVACGKCAACLSTCAICRKPCEATVRAFLS